MTNINDLLDEISVLKKRISDLETALSLVQNGPRNAEMTYIDLFYEFS